MNRRSFLRAVAAAPVAAPAILQASAAPATKSAGISTLGIAVDGSALRAVVADLDTLGSALKVGRAMSFNRRSDRYAYRTGYPAIDALRSVSGVHKARMEKRMDA